MPNLPIVETTLIIAAIFGILHVVFTLRVGVYRKNHKINFGDGGDKELLKRIRAHGNFTENVPIGLLLLLLNELNGLSSTWLLVLGILLLFGRCLHYYAIGFGGAVIFRMLGMISTLGMIFASALLLLF